VQASKRNNSADAIVRNDELSQSRGNQRRIQAFSGSLSKARINYNPVLEGRIHGKSGEQGA